MIFKTFSLMLIVILCLIISISHEKCHNTTEFRYEFRDVAQIQGYNAVCNQFVRRTCCSPKNIDVLARKISKALVLEVQQLSISCKIKLVNLMCSHCDGDVGQGIVKGVCTSYCQELHQVCRNDYFITDTNGKLRVCREGDIVCAKLGDIIPNPSQKKICELFGVVQKAHDCWNGQISSAKKGKGAKKVKYHYKRVIPGRQEDSSIQLQRYKLYAIYIMAALFALLISWKWGLRKMFTRKNKFYHRLDE